MSNYSYLCCSDFPRLYPSERFKAFVQEQHTIACDVNCVPLLWLALFRPSDIRSQRVRFEGDDLPLTIRAPIAECSVALTQLENSLPTLQQLFSVNGSLVQHAQRLGQALSESRGTYVTIEMIEVDGLYNKGEAARLVRRVLKFLESPESELQIVADCESRREKLNRAPQIDKIRYLRQRTNGSVSEIKNMLEQFAGNVFRVIEYFEARQTPVERAGVTWTRFLEGKPRDDEPKLIKQVISDFCGVKLHARFPSPLEFQTSHNLTRDEQWNYSRLLGEAASRPIPW